MATKQKKSLLERYGIPINHLDFKYIEECHDAREMEKIVHILKSNEEGYFPDLTQCAENKLKQLKPESRLLRVEEQIKGREALPAKEWQPIYDWNQEIKTTDKKLKQLLNENNLMDQMPPIRKVGHIATEKKNEEEKNFDTKAKIKTSERIKSTDYDKWDKYDPEEEILRMDLAEERQQEEVERKNRLNAEKIKREPLKITEILEEQDMKSIKGEEQQKWLKLSDIEKEKLSEEFRLRGNEYFRTKEYDHAVVEYTRAIKACPQKAVAAYNNRALTYFKLQRFFDAIKDSEECLKLEPNNLKGRLRLAEATYAYGKRRESYPLYVNILELEPENAVALKAISELRKQFEDLPPPNATRLKIHEESSKGKEKALEKSKVDLTSSKLEQKEEKEKQKEKPKPKKCVDYDLADLVQPNRVVKNNFIKTAETINQKMQNNFVENNKQLNKQDHLNQNEIKIRDICMPSQNLISNKTANNNKNKPLIQEI